MITLHKLIEFFLLFFSKRVCHLERYLINELLIIQLFYQIYFLNEITIKNYFYQSVIKLNFIYLFI